MKKIEKHVFIVLIATIGGINIRHIVDHQYIEADPRTVEN